MVAIVRASVNQEALKLFNYHDKTGIAGDIYQATHHFAQVNFAKFDRDPKYKEIPRDLWLKMGEQGFYTPHISAAYNGMGLPPSQLNMAATLLPIAETSPAIGLSVLAHAVLCARQIDAFGTPAQKDKYLTKLLSGEYIGALAMSEPNAGSAVIKDMTTKAEKVDGGWLMTGNKEWITNGGIADVMVVYARTPLEDKPNAITPFIIETDKLNPAVKGQFEEGKAHDKGGLKKSTTSPIKFDNYFVPDENVLGGVGQGTKILPDGLICERLQLATLALAPAQRALNDVLDYSKTRESGGVPLIDQPIYNYKLAGLATDFDASRSYVLNMAAMVDNGMQMTTLNATQAFLHASIMTQNVTMETVKMFGGNGYTLEYDAFMLHADAILSGIGGGADITKQMIIGQELKKQLFI